MKKTKQRGNGEGTIYKSEKLNRWVAQYCVNGQRKSVYGKTREEVKDKLNKALVKIADNKYIDKSDYTLKNMIDMYNEDDFKANKIAEVTYKRRCETAKIIEKLDISKMKIQKINLTHINNALLTLTCYSNSVIAKIFTLIQSGFNKAILLGVIGSSPFLVKGAIIRPKSQKEDKKIDALTIDEQIVFVKELNSKEYKYKDIFIIALYSGLRIGEILALHKEDIDLSDNIIQINKSLTKDSNDKVIIGKTTKTYAGTRNIPITDLFRSALENNVNNDILFTDGNKLINPVTINSHFKRICKNANIKKDIYIIKRNGKEIKLNTSKVSTHMLRHTYATRCIEAGMSPVVLQKLLGHKDIETTLNTYTSVFNKFKDDEMQKYLDYMNQLH